jgi:hypothetical protein
VSRCAASTGGVLSASLMAVSLRRSSLSVCLAPTRGCAESVVAVPAGAPALGPLAVLEDPASRGDGECPRPSARVRRIRRPAASPGPMPQSVGVDEGAKRSGRFYGTILVDVDIGDGLVRGHHSKPLDSVDNLWSIGANQPARTLRPIRRCASQSRRCRSN